jgi:hypothetical protein
MKNERGVPLNAASSGATLCPGFEEKPEPSFPVGPEFALAPAACETDKVAV